MRKFCWLFWALLPACGPDVATDSTGDDTSSGAGSASSATTTDATTGDELPSTGETPTDATTGDTTTGGVCIEYMTDSKSPYEEIAENMVTCDLADLCPDAAPLVFEQQGEDGWTTDDIERARCMAAALRDRTPGRLQFRHYEGLTDDLRTIEVLGEQAINRREKAEDFGFEYSERVTFLKPPAFFADCADSTALAVRKCLTEAFTDECATTLLCPE